MAPIPSIQSNAVVTLTHVESGKSYGVARTKSGAGKAGESQVIRPGGMAPPVAVAGTWTYEDLTVSRLVEFQTDSGLNQELNDLYGDYFDVTHQPTDSKGRAGFHRPVTARGRLNGVTPVEYDADSNDPSVLELVFVVDTVS